MKTTLTSQEVTAYRRMDALAQVPDSKLRAAVIESLRELAVPRRYVERSALIRSILRRAGGLEGVELEATAFAFENIYGLFMETFGRAPKGENPDVARIEALIWELIARGLFYPRIDVQDVKPLPLVWCGVAALVPTTRGIQFLLSNHLHPSQPDFVSRAAADATDLPREVMYALEDAQQCYNNDLLRASIVMLGLAYETMAEKIYEKRVSTKVPWQQQPRIAKIREVVAGTDETRLACTVAEDLRLMRNRATHEWRLDFYEPEPVELMLIMAARNVAPFWSMFSA